MQVSKSPTKIVDGHLASEIDDLLPWAHAKARSSRLVGALSHYLSAGVT